MNDMIYILDCNVTNRSGKGVPLRLMLKSEDEMHRVIEWALLRFDGGFRVLGLAAYKVLNEGTACGNIEDAANSWDRNHDTG